MTDLGESATGHHSHAAARVADSEADGKGIDTSSPPAHLTPAPDAVVAPQRPVRSWERVFFERLLRRCGQPAVALELWDGSVVGDATARGRIVMRSPRVLSRLLLQPTLGFGEAYMAGEIELPGDMVATLTEVNLGLSRCTRRRPSSGYVRRVWDWTAHTLNGARANVAHHYDLGNHFYELWLDRQMVYTCAYYEHAAASLEDAQTAKLDYVCRKLRLQPGERVAEAGCGWGALALHMARHYGVHVKAWNLSREQIAYATERARREGLSDRVEFIKDDYRSIRGTYDAFVSVGMLEHVGTERYRAFGDVLNRVLSPRGRGLIHSIGRNWARPLDPWTTKYIFPGACPGSLKQMLDLFETQGFSVLDVENLRPHYARTCADWLARFEHAADRVRQMFNERFVRMWRFYLAASTATFLSGDLQLFQIVFARAADDSLPWTRSDWYTAAAQPEVTATPSPTGLNRE